MNGSENNMADSISQLVVCPSCGNRFELSESFREQFEEEKRKEIDAAMRENEVRVRAEMENANQAKLAESAKQLETLQAQIKADQEAQEKREAEIRAEMEQANQAQLSESAKQLETLQAQIKADQEAQEKREAEIRAEMEQANQAQLSESAKQLETLQAQIKADQEAQEKREAKIRADAKKASQVLRAKSAKQVRELEAQIKADRKTQEKREAEIRIEAEKANQAKLAESAEELKALQAQIKADQEAQEKREAEIRAEVEQANQAKLSESVKQLETLQAQIKADQEAQEKREAKIRADAKKASQVLRAKSAKQVRELEAQIKADRKTQEKREAEIRIEAEKANQAKLAESAEELKALQAQLKADQEAQEKREAEIRAEMEQASQAKLSESAEELKALQAQLKADQEAQEKREVEIRAEVEKANQSFELEREKYTIEKTRLEKQMADMQRQLRQSSTELQGEVLEVFLKQQLMSSFPFDNISDIRRGRKGADLTQEVVDAQLGACGTVVWEAKRTKHWNDTWIAKIKEDADRLGAHVRVIVSLSLPKGIRIFDLRDGVWVSSLEGAIPLALALRSQLIQSTRLQRAVQGKGLKMDEVYNYLTSPRFSERIQRIVDTWVALEEQVNREERSMQRQWKERRKQLERLRDSTIEMYTDFSAIFGQEIAQVPGLQMESLPPGDATEVIDI